MKKIVLSAQAANDVANLRSQYGGFESEKCEIADSLCGLVDMIQFGIDDNDVTPFTNDILKAMNVISNYNVMINHLNETFEVAKPQYGLVQKMEKCGWDEHVPSEKQWSAIKRILEDKGIQSDVFCNNGVTYGEISNMLGIAADDLRSLVSSILSKA